MNARPWGIALGCFVAGSLAAMSIANATSAPTKIPDSTTGVITACMVKKTGAVRFINAQAGKTCTTKEKKITFNQTGPQGTQGVQGERGPSNTFVKNTAVLGTIISTTGTDLVSLTLPAGNYLLQAQTTLVRTDGATTNVVCRFQTTSGTLTADPAFWIPKPAAEVGMENPMTIVGTLSSAGADTVVDFNCSAGGADALALAGGVLTATEVGQVTVQ